MMSNIETDVALLAPVPHVHLASARSMEGRIAFGTRSYVISDLERLRNGKKVDVYIYASHAGGYDNSVTWKARYIGFVEAVGGCHPDKTHRPETTLADTPDSLLFWEIEDLIELSKLPKPTAPIPLNRFRTWVEPSKYNVKNRGKVIKAPPHGPTLVWADLEPIKP